MALCKIIFFKLPSSSSTVYFTVPVPTMLWVPNPSTSPEAVVYVIKSHRSLVSVVEHPESSIASTESESNDTCDVVDVQMCAPRWA